MMRFQGTPKKVKDQAKRGQGSGLQNAIVITEATLLAKKEKVKQAARRKSVSGKKSGDSGKNRESNKVGLQNV